METVTIEVFSPPALMLEGLCTACQVGFGASGLQERFAQAQFETFPDDLVEEAVRFNAMVDDVVERHRGRVTVKVLDPQSLEGMWKQLRYWAVGRYPTWIVNGKVKVAGWDETKLESAIESALAAA